MKIILDERETALYEKCVLLNSHNPVKIDISKRVLQLGDAILATDNGEELIIVERKSLQDLLSSIKDGRYEEQSYRLIHSSGHIPHRILYVVEGIMSQLNTVAEKKMVYSAITSLNMFKGFSVFRTSSVQETADWLLCTTDKMGRELEKGRILWSPPLSLSTESSTNVEPLPYCNVVKKVKKDNITPENWSEIVLCQIPGVSSKSAIAIMKQFRSIAHLINSLKERPDCLEGIVCESASEKKPRKLGKHIIKNIADFLLYSVQEDQPRLLP
jgi:ERCC4-type nuclease